MEIYPTSSVFFSFRSGCELDIWDYARIVAEHFNITAAEIIKQDRLQSKSRIRNVFYYISMNVGGYSSTEIGNAIGRDHTSVLNGCQSAQNAKGKYWECKTDISRILDKIEKMH
jgi:chromosomal replication initiation ATPase DnaA